MKKLYHTYIEMLSDNSNRLPYRYLLAYSMSSRSVGMTDELIPCLNWNEVVEFRCFDENGEIHGFPSANGVCIVEITKEEEKAPNGNIQDSIIQEYPFVNTAKSNLGNTLIVQRNIQYDGDGQGCIISSRCYGFTQKGEY